MGLRAVVLRSALLAAALAAGLGGCTRAKYRQSADDEVYGLIGRGACDPRWKLPECSITPHPDSRMYDPYNPDRPPMPPDDPTSHTLMECVDGKKGWPHWDRNGCAPSVENPAWRERLPRDADGALPLDRSAAVRLALINSREYQRALESLYLSALDVTFQRFRFDVQFFGANSTFFTADGPDRPGGGGHGSSLLAERNALELRKFTATGGELLAGVANSLVWQFAGPDQYTATSLLDFSFVQPLLRAGGRAVALENLTEAERTLLANIRQMERFRHGFFTQIVAGRNPGAGPGRGGLGIDALQPSFVGNVGGILALMEAEVRINNQRANVAGLRESLDQLEAFYDAGRIDSLQVEQTRQTLYNAQSQLMALQNVYQDNLDAYKIVLGLPPELPVKIADPLLKRFDLIDPKTVAAQESVADLLTVLRGAPAGAAAAELPEALERIAAQCDEVLLLVEGDMRRLDETMPSRRAFLQSLATRRELAVSDVDPGVADIAAFERRLAAIRLDFQKQHRQATDGLVAFRAAGAAPDKARPGDGAAAGAAGAGDGERRRQVLAAAGRLRADLFDLALTQGRCRVESVTLVPVALGSVEALDIARQNRLDWMNARAALVDQWRQIEVAANALKGDLNVVFSGDMGTVGNNPLQFRSTTGRLRAGVQFDPPLTRLAERNLYREALIDYQQARRQYYAYEDRVSQGLRDTLRTIARYQLDFELRRAAVHVAISQVDVMQLRLQKPPKPGETTVLGATTARDLVQALTGLLSSQNSFLTAWVDYEAQRMNLDFDLGTMRLDAGGNWIDPGPIASQGRPGTADGPPLPPEVIVPPPPIPNADNAG